MPTFPLAVRPKQDYHKPPLCFGCKRDAGKRFHAGVDLYAPVETTVYSVMAGEVIRGLYLFYQGVYAIDVRLSDGRVVRYGEIGGVASGIGMGSVVHEGQPIASVGHILGLNISMIHFELYRGNVEGRLTVNDAPPFYRRTDLIDPTEFLDGCEFIDV
jgi:murein DD-endopeptidase MepM/ murein hydrolase activator NlpD